MIVGNFDILIIMKNDHPNNKFSIVKRAKSFVHAGRGIGVFIRTTHNAWLHIDIDLTSPEYHPYARDTKDVAAGAVLIQH